MDGTTSHGLTPALLQQLYRHTWYHNLKIPLFYGLLGACGTIAWNAPQPWIEWLGFLAMGYLWMSIVTFMHDCTHNVLFKARWKNWAFGLFSTIPILITFISFKEDHLEHHRHNRTVNDPDAFTMGKRGVLDFVLFYAYITIGGLLTIIQFTLIYPAQKFRGARLGIHLAEIALRIAVIAALLVWTAHHGVQAQFLRVWLIPVAIFTVLNSMRFLAEHYDTPWNAGQLAGTRTTISNRINSFFWNNINYHIGHHVYSGVPWYNLQKLHAALLPEIERQGGIVSPSYLGVYARALRGGPESIERNAAARAIGT